jgi:hypothetical protein
MTLFDALADAHKVRYGLAVLHSFLFRVFIPCHMYVLKGCRKKRNVSSHGDHGLTNIRWNMQDLHSDAWPINNCAGRLKSYGGTSKAHPRSFERKVICPARFMNARRYQMIAFALWHTHNAPTTTTSITTTITITTTMSMMEDLFVLSLGCCLRFVVIVCVKTRQSSALCRGTFFVAVKLGMYFKC